jgi:hypothetical protein
MSGQSPLKAKPLRLPGESVDDEIVRLRESALMDHLFVAACVFLLAFIEWFGYLTNSGRHPSFSKHRLTVRPNARVLWTVIAGIVTHCHGCRRISRLCSRSIARHPLTTTNNSSDLGW